jgi:hypothetical protein
MQIIYLDISNKGVIPCIQAKQSEVGRKFLAVITDNGQPYILSNDSLLSVWYEGDTDAGNYSSIENRSAFSVHRNNVTVELVAQMLLSPGKGELCLSISKGDGTETNTWNIPYEVEYKPGATSTIPTEYYTALTEAGSLAASVVGEAKDAADEAKAAAEQAKDAANATELLEKIIPVGYIFQWDVVEGSGIDLSTAEKVAAHFGIGTWEQIQDTFLLSCGDKHTAGERGGAETHTLTIDEMPSHTHDIRWKSGFTGTGSWNALRRAVDNDAYDGVDASALSAGGDQPFSIMPPYKAVYVWKRIA